MTKTKSNQHGGAATRRPVRRNILARAGMPLLDGVAASRVALIFDFDGTLAPLVDNPAAARLRDRTRRLLCDLCRAYPVAVVSGRARSEVAVRLAGIPIARIVGNHGLEAERPSPPRRLRAEVARWYGVLVDRFAASPGIVIEDKGYSVSIHYRRAHDRRHTLAEIERVAAGLYGARLIGGKYVVNVLPQGAPGKGAAVLRLRRQLGCATALYVGDDLTDEEVFSVDQPDRLWSVRVGRSRATHARYFIVDQRAVDRLLDRLLALRAAQRQPLEA